MKAPLRVSVDEASRRLGSEDYVVLSWEGAGEIGFYAPRNVDEQTPHERDELYVIATGTGSFVHGGETTPFVPGDALFVAAGVPHRFENFTRDFSTWVVFFG